MDTNESNAWYYERSGAQAGPVPKDVLTQMAATGEITANTLVWRAGMNEWKPLSLELGVPMAAGQIPGGRRCDECGKTFPASEILDLRGHAVCAGCKPVVLQKLAEGVAPSGGGEGVWRKAKTLIFRNGAQLPSCCVKCGAPAQTRLPRTLYWHKPWIYALVVISVWVYVIVALIVRKKAQVAVPLCDLHQSKRKSALVAVWLMLAGMIGSIIAAAALEKPWIAVFALACLIGMIIAGVRTRLLVPTLIDERFVHAKGCAPEFLARLPEYRDGV